MIALPLTEKNVLKILTAKKEKCSLRLQLQFNILCTDKFYNNHRFVSAYHIVQHFREIAEVAALPTNSQAFRGCSHYNSLMSTFVTLIRLLSW